MAASPSQHALQNSCLKQFANNHRKLEYARKMIQLKARDHTRTPMQWDATSNAGFCRADVKPWMRVNDDFRVVNVTAQVDNPQSVLSYWKSCLAIRRGAQGQLGQCGTPQAVGGRDWEMFNAGAPCLGVY